MIDGHRRKTLADRDKLAPHFNQYGGDMNAKKVIACLGLAAAWLAVPIDSFAEKCAGTNINNLVSWEPTEIGKGTTLATMRTTSVTVSDDPSASYHLASGECIGTFLTTPDGKTKGSGSCARKDKEGDVLNEEWVSTDGTGGKGNGKYVGGTGKYVKTTGTTQWEFTQLQGKMAAVRWTGNCQ
jgi:hypothetical protein